MTANTVFLHIGKTGGTAIREALRDQPGRGKKKSLEILGHQWTFAKILKRKQAEHVIFFIREPSSRFVSAFNSRLRQGLPRYFSPWTKEEEAAFKRFKTPNELAESLSSWNPFRRRAAVEAIKAIKHCRLGYHHYLGGPNLLEKHKQNIQFIGEIEHIQSDFDLLKRLIGADPKLVLPDDDVKSHKAPDDLSKKLSARASKNLQKYFKKDYKIYVWCKAHREVIMADFSERGMLAESCGVQSSSNAPDNARPLGQPPARSTA